MLSKNLQRIRTRKKLTQQELADAAGVSRPRIAEIESGANPNPTLFTIQVLAKALDCTAEALIRAPKK
jgi:transcriptional regulator with XRE-family HTH domain